MILAADLERSLDTKRARGEGGSIAVGDPKLKIRYNGPIQAPIAKGQQVAELVVTMPDGTVQRTPLVAAEEVEEAGFFGRFWIGLKQLVGLA